VIGPRRSWVVAVLAGLSAVVLVVAGRGELAAPPLRGVGPWVDEIGPVVAAVALLRLVALGAAAWLAVVAVVAAVAEAVGADALAGAAERSLPPALRRVLAGLAGAGTAGVVVLGATGTATPGAADAPPPVERLVRLPGAPVDPPPVATMAVLDAAAPTPTPAAPAVAPSTWTVAPGDSFWSIAEDLLAERLDRPPTDAEVDAPWRALIDANRDRLVTGDPDLLVPGQVLLLPDQP
jgi:nucleoid-associated protein YgaU